MHNHFDRNLNLKSIILERKPSVVVECGAGNGELTRLIATLLDDYDFEFHVISDYPVEGLDPRIKWKTGISYNAITDFNESSIDLCILDTDHNYWTLMKEFSALFSRVKEGGLIALHDVETFYHDSGMALSYSNGAAYPKDEIEKLVPYGGLGDAMIEFLHIKKLNYKLFAYNRESNGAAVIEKRSQPIFNLFTPGPAAVFANKDMATA